MNTIILKNNWSQYHTVIRYPDGQKSLKLNVEKLNIKKPITIECRIRNFDELEILICLVSALRSNDFYLEKLKFNYLYGLRSDRTFEPGQPNYLRDVLAPIIKNMRFNSVELYAPHSIFSKTIGKKVFDVIIVHDNHNIFSNKIMIGGDSSFNLLWCHTHFNKIRYKNGEFKLNLEESNSFLFKNLCEYTSILICDDLADGGRTFVEEAKYLRILGYKGRIELFVVHGLFTQGINYVADSFDHIYCTNSYQNIEHPKVTQINIWSTEYDK